MNTEVRSWYLKNYPSDELGKELYHGITFDIVYENLQRGNGERFYELVGVHDSLVRERIFEAIAVALNQDYDHVYNLWLHGGSDGK